MAAPGSVSHPFIDNDVPNATQYQALCQVCVGGSQEQILSLEVSLYLGERM